MRAARASALLTLVAAMTLTGCGASSKYIATSKVVRAFRAAGLHGVQVYSVAHAEADFEKSVIGKAACSHAKHGCTTEDIDVVYLRAYRVPPNTLVGVGLFLPMPLLATRFPNAATAKRRLASDQQFVHGTPWPGLPKSFITGLRSGRFRETRICNVVVSSYRRPGRSAPARRFDAVVAHLKPDC